MYLHLQSRKYQRYDKVYDLQLCFFHFLGVLGHHQLINDSLNFSIHERG